MGYDRSSGWTSGSFYSDVQSSLDITLDDVDCNGESWSSCDYQTTPNCDHSEDVYLTCMTGETFQFSPYQTMKNISHATFKNILYINVTDAPWKRGKRKLFLFSFSLSLNKHKKIEIIWYYQRA